MPIRATPWTTALLLATLLVACAGDDTGTDSSERPGIHPASEIRISGVAKVDGAAVRSSEARGQLLLIVRSGHHGEAVIPAHPMAHSGEGCPDETQHRSRSFAVPIADDGSFSLVLPVSELEPVSHPKCPLSSVDMPRLTALRMTAQLDGRQASARRGTDAASPAGDLEASALELEFEPAPQLPGTSGSPGSSAPSAPPGSSEPVAMPDLIVDAETARRSITFREERFEAESCAMRESCLSGTGLRKLLRFDGAIVNVGPVPLVVGDPARRGDAAYDACHEHFHLGGLMSYELRSSDGSLVARGRKQGFCLMDSAPGVPGAGEGRFTCDNQGISPGWSDVYDRALDCQWIDVTDVEPGEYLLTLRVNPDLVFEEADYSNNSIEVPVRIMQ